MVYKSYSTPKLARKIQDTPPELPEIKESIKMLQDGISWYTSKRRGWIISPQKCYKLTIDLMANIDERRNTSAIEAKTHH